MADHPRALLIAPYFFPRNYGGAVQLYDGLIRRWRTIRTTVISERQGAPPGEVEDFDRTAPGTRGYEVRRIGRMCFRFRGPRPVLNAADCALFFATAHWAFRRHVARVRPDVVICGGVYAAGWLANMVPRRIARVNYVLGEEITQEIPGGPLSRYLRREQVRALRRADANVALSRFTAEALTRFAGLNAASVQLQPGCVDTDRFHVPLDRPGGREKWGWPDRTVLLTVARLVPRKGIDRVLQALALLSSQDRLPSDWIYVIAGRGPEEERLRGLCAEWNLLDRVRFLGFVADDELPGLYAAADLFVLANRDIRGDTEGFGLVFLEANACGLPVIGGTAGGTADAIENEVSGLRVDVEDARALADAIGRLMNDPQRRREMSRAGLERVRGSFSIARGAAALEELLLRIIREKR